MKNRIISIIVALLILCALLCACTGNNTNVPADTGTTVNQPDTKPTETEPAKTEPADTEPEAEPESMTCGNWTVDVPAGYEFKIGDTFDENDTRYFSVKKSFFSYFDFKAEGEERIMASYNYNKDTYTNEQKDVSGTFGGIEWTGFQYGDGFGGYGFEAYATIDGEMIRVSSAGFEFDDSITALVLGSLKYTPSEN